MDIVNLEDKVIVINFWNLKCKPCIEEIPILNTLVNDFNNEPVIFIAITEDKKNSVKDYFKRTNKSFHYRIVTDGESIIWKYVRTPLYAKGFDEWAYTDSCLRYAASVAESYKCFKA